MPELWLIPADGKPRPLGLLRADRTVTIAIPPEFASTDGQQRRAGGIAGAAGRLAHRRSRPGPVIGTGKLTSL